MMRFRIQIDPALLEMTPLQFEIALDQHSACLPAKMWAMGKRPMGAWAQCQDGEFMLWALLHLTEINRLDYVRMVFAVCSVEAPTREERMARVAANLRAVVDFYL